MSWAGNCQSRTKLPITPRDVEESCCDGCPLCWSHLLGRELHFFVAGMHSRRWWKLSLGRFLQTHTSKFPLFTCPSHVDFQKLTRGLSMFLYLGTIVLQDPRWWALSYSLRKKMPHSQREQQAGAIPSNLETSTCFPMPRFYSAGSPRWKRISGNTHMPPAVPSLTVYCTATSYLWPTVIPPSINHTALRHLQ